MTIFDEEYTGPRFTYGFRNRPPGIGCQPDGFIAGSDRDHPSYRWGTRQWPRPLTEAEVYSYELELVEAVAA